MTEQAKPLGATGSITPGRSVAAMFELAANPDELVVSERLREAWGAVNHLYTHIDNRLDLDHPESKPEGAPDEVEWRGWLEYLHNPEAEAPQDGSLTDLQQQAFTDMRSQFDTLGTPSKQRTEFVISIWQYMEAAKQAKQATKIGGLQGLAYWRQREALAIAHMFTSVVPLGGEDGRRENFGRFVRIAGEMGRAFKLYDSYKDMDRDMDSHNVNIEPSLTRYARLLGRAAWHGVGVIARRPQMFKAALEKRKATHQNRRGDLNDQRIHA